MINIKKFDKKANDLADKVIEAAKSGDRVEHWKAVYALLRYQNKKARKEQDKTAKGCAEVRAAKVLKTKKTDKLGLRWGVSIPPMTWDALVRADELAYGTSSLLSTNKEEYVEGIKGSNSIVRDLERAFPQYKVS